MSKTNDSGKDAAWFRTETRGGTFRLIAGGEWVTHRSATLDPQLRKLDVGGARKADIDGSEIEKLDSAGAWLLLRAKRQFEEEGATVGEFTLPEIYHPLLHTMDRDHSAPPVTIHSRHTFEAFLGRIGAGVIHALKQGRDMLGYLGNITVETIYVIGPQKQLRWTAFVHQIEETGINALPIVGLLSFLIGIVLAYQGADQLRRFGAEIFTINLLGVGMLREIGGLMTAIIMAGRSGSSFTAQIGTMKVNEEIDAMETMGLNTVNVLVLPRILGLMVTLPMLTFYAGLMGMIGGAVMCYFDLGISFPAFMRQLHLAINVNTVLVGIIKAPVFAFVIGLVGCYEGLQVERNAASVGKLTTRSVVESIFLIIVLDAGFSILFSILGI
ncbi:MAG TPA: MlaE family lipid ABC transporter permease subunit [Rhizomicrobium sp.]|jgi:phospholipid/cholesterol/gamma-HCH transport system permease protein|nr:MlaE family lipid ABC transporter permease subunit [Rhizomicrobium sp.]